MRSNSEIQKIIGIMGSYRARRGEGVRSISLEIIEWKKRSGPREV
jgi:hypothetical protein